MIDKLGQMDPLPFLQLFRRSDVRTKLAPPGYILMEVDSIENKWTVYVPKTDAPTAAVIADEKKEIT